MRRLWRFARYVLAELLDELSLRVHPDVEVRRRGTGYAYTDRRRLP